MSQDEDDRYATPSSEQEIKHLSFVKDLLSDKEDDKLLDSITRFDRTDTYSDGDVIAKGGLKLIHKVRDRKTSREVAKATIKPNQLNSINIDRFLKEAKILASLEHTNIVPIYDIDYDRNKNVFFTMKLLGGETLASIIKKIKNKESAYTEKFNRRKLLGIFMRTCDAVSFAHSKGIVHLDLKPDNIQISDFSEVYVIDWGMAEYIDESKASYCSTDLLPFSTITNLNTIPAGISGTPGYMSPEQCDKDNSNRSITSDIYSLGATLYAMLYQQHPHHGLSLDDIIERTREGVLTEFPDTDSDIQVPAALQAIMRKAMQVDTELRYSNVPELQKDISNFMNDMDGDGENIEINKLIKLFIQQKKKTIIIAVSILCIVAVTIRYLLN